MSSYNKILNNITHCETKNKIIPFTKILEYATKEKIIPKNSNKEIIPKDSKYKSFSNSNKNIRNMLKYHKKDSNETPKNKIRNLFLNSRNEDNKLFLSNKISTNSNYKSNKYNTIEGRQLSARKRHSKNIFSIPKDKAFFPELNLFKKKNELFKTINENENFNTIKLNDTNSIQTSSKKLGKYNINHKSTFQKGIDLNSLKLTNSQNKKISNLKKIYYQIEMKNKNQAEKILVDNSNINTDEVINYNSRKSNKNNTHKYLNNLTVTPKLRQKRKSAFNFRPQNKTQKDKNHNKVKYVSSDSDRLKRKKHLTKNYKIMIRPHKFHNLNKNNFQLLSVNESESESDYDKIDKIRSRNNTDDGKSYIIKRANTHKSSKILKHSYNMVNKYISNLLNENKKFNNSSKENENKSNLENKKLDLNDFFKKDFFNLGDKSLNAGKNIIIFSEKKSSMDIKKILCNIYINKDEDKYIMKKRMKMKDKVSQSNKASYLYKEYAKEFKYSFLRNAVIDKMTEKMMENYKPLENKRKLSIVFEKEKEIYFSKLFNGILDKCHKIYYSFEDIVMIGKSLGKYVKNKNKIKINCNHILEMFDVYQTLLKQFENKWKLLKSKDIHYYKKMNGIFSSIKKKYSNHDFYIYKYRIKNELILSLDNNSFNIKLSPNKLDNNISKTIKIKDNNSSRFSSKKNIKLNAYSKFKNLNSGNKKRLTFLFQKMGLFGFDNNFKILKNSPDNADSGKLKKKDNFNIFTKVYGMDDNNYNQLEKGKEFNIAESNINNYNVLKNKKLFNMNNIEEETELKKKYSKKNNFIDNLNKKYLENITYKYHDLDSMSKLASVIKTQEIQRDDPDSKFFYKIVDALSNRKMKDFDYLIRNEEEALNRIINRQEISSGNTLLMYATINNLKSIVESLLKKGAEPNIQNNFGNSALHLAYRNDNFFIINLLVEYGAEQKLKNIDGLYPWQMSKFINS